MQKLRFILITLALTGVSNSAHASASLEDFESYTDGSLLHGQGGWKGWSNDPAAGAVVSAKHAHSGTKSVEILGTSDLVHEFRLAGNQWALSAQQYIPSGGTGVSYFIVLNTYADGGPNDWSIRKYQVTDPRDHTKSHVHWQIAQIPYLRADGVSKQPKENQVPDQMKDTSVQPHVPQ